MFFSFSLILTFTGVTPAIQSCSFLLFPESVRGHSHTRPTCPLLNFLERRSCPWREVLDMHAHSGCFPVACWPASFHWGNRSIWSQLYPECLTLVAPSKCTLSPREGKVLAWDCQHWELLCRKCVDSASKWRIVGFLTVDRGKKAFLNHHFGHYGKNVMKI